MVQPALLPSKGCFSFLLWTNIKGQTTECGIPQPFRATMRYRIHLGFDPDPRRWLVNLASYRFLTPDFAVHRTVVVQLGRHRFLA